MNSKDFEGIFCEWIFHKFFDLAVEKLKANIAIQNKEFISDNSGISIELLDEENLISQLLFCVKQAENWSQEIGFKDLERPKSLTKVFIDLDFFLTQRRLQYNIGTENRITLSNLIKSNNKNLIILGAPGAGKTTLCKYLCSLILTRNENFKNFSAPIVIRLREIEFEITNKSVKIFDLFDILINIFGLQIKFNQEKNNDSPIVGNSYIVNRIVVNFLDDLGVFLIIDGFDEITNNKFRTAILNDLNTLALSLNNSKFILTSRTGDFQEYIERTSIYEICALNEKQIKTFIKKWTNNAKKAGALLRKLYLSPFQDTAIRPLTLAHICAIYDRYGDIPDKPKSMYSKIVMLLLEEWDRQRGIKRISKYGNFQIERKFEFLSNFAFKLSIDYGKTVFNKDNLQLVYERIHRNFDLPKEEMQLVVNELESHNGLFVQTGYDQFEFAHKSIQEYLSADFIAKLPTIPKKSALLFAIPNELAIAVSISSNPNLYFATLILELSEENDEYFLFINRFLSRLLIENPDFNESPSLAIAINEIYNYVVSRSNEAEDTDFDPNIDNYLTIKQSLDDLLRLKSVRRTFYRLRDNYLPSVGKISSPSKKYKWLDPPLYLLQKKLAAQEYGIDIFPETLVMTHNLFLLYKEK